MEKQISSVEKQMAHAYKYLRDEKSRMGSYEPTGGEIPYLQGALVALEPQSGAIRALVGGRNFAESKFNRATQALRQPGSAFKPIVFAQAILDGRKTNDILLDTPLVREIPESGNRMKEWTPQNFDNEFRGPVSLRHTLKKSINIPSIRLIEEVGPRRVVTLAREMGIDRNLPPYPSLALGTGEMTPLEITAAYGVFANQGIYVEPYLVERVENRYGNLQDQHHPSSHEAIDERTSYIMISLLESVMNEGTGISARTAYGFKAPAGGKTGTTDDYSNAWFVGFIPRLACGVWVGFDENSKTIGRRMTGAKAALPAWSAFMKEAAEIYGDEDFHVPDGITRAVTCKSSGLLATPACPKVNDVFISGTQPSRICPIHRGLPIWDWPSQSSSEEAAH